MVPGLEYGNRPGGRRRHTGMKPIMSLLGAGLAAATVTACASTSPSGSGATTSVPESTTTTSAGPRELRGSPVARFACPTTPTEGGRAPVRVAVSSVTGVLLCPTATPSGSGSEVTLTPSDPAFDPLLVALARPDDPRSTGPCPMYADLVQPVVARTSSVVILVHVPVDGCLHYQAPARAAIAQARGTA